MSTYGHEDFFKELKSFKKLQTEQRKRGLNDYNLLTSVLKPSDEVRLHSRMIASLLDPSGKHYQEDLFLNIFLEVIGFDKWGINTKNCTVYREHKNIDIYITDGSKHIIIENKIYATDQKNQIKRYVDLIRNENEDISEDDILTIYLSPYKRAPSAHSLGSLSIEGDYLTNKEKLSCYRSINYKKDILKWLRSCLHEINNITNLSESLKQYIDVIKMVTRQYKGKSMSLSDFITKNEDNYILSMEVCKAIPRLKQEKTIKSFQQIKLNIEEDLGEEWEVEIGKNLIAGKPYSFPFRIYKKRVVI